MFTYVLFWSSLPDYFGRRKSVNEKIISATKINASEKNVLLKAAKYAKFCDFMWEPVSWFALRVFGLVAVGGVLGGLREFIGRGRGLRGLGIRLNVYEVLKFF